MKKIYRKPVLNVVKIQIENVLNTASLGVGSDISSGDADSRSMDWDEE
ncbi:MAG: hypothetical protein K6D91_04870 [Prevotella sp.]|nr:hypothetical protein [Prevotella sp.]